MWVDSSVIRHLCRLRKLQVAFVDCLPSVLKDEGVPCNGLPSVAGMGFILRDSMDYPVDHSCESHVRLKLIVGPDPYVSCAPRVRVYCLDFDPEASDIVDLPFQLPSSTKEPLP